MEDEHLVQQWLHKQALLVPRVSTVVSLDALPDCVLGSPMRHPNRAEAKIKEDMQVNV